MITVEIDGKKTVFDSYYEESAFGHCGAIWGCDETTQPEDSVRNFRPNRCVWSLAAYRHEPDGSIFGIDGLFKRGEWSTDEDGNPLYRVWERIA